MKILNIGSMNLDRTYKVDHFAKEGETIAAGNMNVFPGGKGLNQSTALSRAGANVYHAGCYGNGGEPLYSLLEQTGVNVALLKKIDAEQGHALIQVDAQGQNCIIVYAGSNGCIDKEQIDDILSQCSDDDVILLQNEVSNVPYIIERAYQMNIKVILNPSPIDDVIRDIDFDKIWWLLVNKVEGKEITGKLNCEDICTELSRRYPKLNYVLTKGKGGATCKCGDIIVNHGIYDVQVTDTTAAGDTFTGYFVAGVIAGDDLETVMRNASIASSICVSRSGAATSIPTLEEVSNASLSAMPLIKKTGGNV